MGKRGPKLTQVDWKQVERMAFLQFTGEEMALVQGIDYDTLNRLCIRDNGKSIGEWNRQKRISVFDNDFLISLSAGYNTIFSFKTANIFFYNVAKEKGILPLLLERLTKYKWDDVGKIKQEALKYKTRNDFCEESSGCYSSAQKKGLLDVVCSHMEPSDTGFDIKKKATLYYINLIGTSVYKIGITNNNIKRRFGGELDKIRTVKTWLYDNGKDALDMEQHILGHYRESRYMGAKLLNSGNTEMFCFDVMGIDEWQPS